MEINITGFSDWGLGIGDWEALPSHQSLVPDTRQLVFNGSLATYQFPLIFRYGIKFWLEAHDHASLRRFAFNAVT
ncbi:MAG TPA: hypothetical protein V6D30_16420 [Leptolyngbyaceae cyanobacterium]